MLNLNIRLSQAKQKNLSNSIKKYQYITFLTVMNILTMVSIRDIIANPKNKNIKYHIPEYVVTNAGVVTIDTVLFFIAVELIIYDEVLTNCKFSTPNPTINRSIEVMAFNITSVVSSACKFSKVR